MITVTVRCDDISCEIEFETNHYVPDIISDLTQRAAVGLGQAVAQLTVIQEAMDDED